jgi:hypothetical protein
MLGVSLMLNTRLSFYCQDDTIDVIPMAFLYVFFGEGGEPVIDFSNVSDTIFLWLWQQLN